MNLVPALGLPLPATLRKPLPSPRDLVFLIWKMGPFHQHVCQEAAGRGAASTVSPPGSVPGRRPGDVTDAHLPCLFLSPTETTEPVVENQTLGPDGLGSRPSCFTLAVTWPLPASVSCSVKWGN